MAFRETAAAIDEIVSDALPSLVEVAETLDADSLTLRDGGLPIDELRQAQPSIGAAQDVVAEVNGRLLGISTDDVLPQIGEAVQQVQSLAGDADDVLTGLDIAARLLPPMLGGGDERKYLMLFQNNAELRAGGGIPGATAILEAVSGTVELGEQAASSDFRAPGGQPIVELTDQELSIFGDQLGRFVQNVTQTPDFARTGELARAWWQQVGGVSVDGVLSLDPVALSYLLEVTGPVQLSDGSRLDADNAVSLLLNDTYLNIEDPRAQDVFFADAAATVFSRVAAFDGDASEMLDALSRAVSERRILVWSVDEGEQDLLSDTPLAGGLPASDSTQSSFGIFLNDATGAKMSYYLEGHFGAVSEVCRNDRRPEFLIGARLTSTAPPNPETLPLYITGSGRYGVEPGSVRTLVQIVLPPGAVVTQAYIGGEETDVATSLLGDQLVATLDTLLTPGSNTDVAIRVLGDAGASEQIILQHTPMASTSTISVESSNACSGIGTVTP